ncbi:MAG: hypothetical protein ACREBU_08030 [Nitrososphaera sp.]
MSQRMNTTQFTFPSDREIVMERVFDAPAAHVFKACIDPNLIPQWWSTTFDQLAKALEE